LVYSENGARHGNHSDAQQWQTFSPFSSTVYDFCYNLDGEFLVHEPFYIAKGQ
jgi:hypothetical protein